MLVLKQAGARDDDAPWSTGGRQGESGLEQSRVVTRLAHAARRLDDIDGGDTHIGTHAAHLVCIH